MVVLKIREFDRFVFCHLSDIKNNKTGLRFSYALFTNWNRTIAFEFESFSKSRTNENFKSIESTDPEPFEAAVLEMNWLSEWAKVSKPYLDNNLTGLPLKL